MNRAIACTLVVGIRHGIWGQCIITGMQRIEFDSMHAAIHTSHWSVEVAASGHLLYEYSPIIALVAANMHCACGLWCMCMCIRCTHGRDASHAHALHPFHQSNSISMGRMKFAIILYLLFNARWPIKVRECNSFATNKMVFSRNFQLPPPITENTAGCKYSIEVEVHPKMTLETFEW